MTLKNSISGPKIQFFQALPNAGPRAIVAGAGAKSRDIAPFGVTRRRVWGTSEICSSRKMRIGAIASPHRPAKMTSHAHQAPPRPPHRPRRDRRLGQDDPGQGPSPAPPPPRPQGGLLPRADPRTWGREIKRLAARADSLTPEEELDLFVKDRRENVERNLRPALAAGKVVVLDRYYFSTIAYQGAKGIDTRPDPPDERGLRRPRPTSSSSSMSTPPRGWPGSPAGRPATSFSSARTTSSASPASSPASRAPASSTSTAAATSAPSPAPSGLGAPLL